MSTPDDRPPVPRVHRPPRPDHATTGVDELPAGGDASFIHTDAPDKPAVPVSPRVLGAILLALVVLATAYAVLPALIGGGSRPSTAAITAPTDHSTSPTPSPAAPTTVSPSVVPPVGTTAPPPVPVAGISLEEWYDRSGAPLVQSLQSLLADLQPALASRDVTALTSGCRELADLADDARSQRPPGTAVQVAAGWDDAWDETAAAADDCVTAAESDEPAAGRRALDRARDALHDLQEDARASALAS